MAVEIVDTHGAPILPRVITHFGDGSTPLTNRDISADLQVLTDLKKGADNSDGQAVETANILKVIARNYQWDGSVWSRLLGRTANTDGVSGSLDYLLTKAVLHAYDPTGGHDHWDRVQIKDLSGDGLGTSQLGLITQAVPRLFNGTNLDRARNNQELTLLASADTTVNRASADVTNHNARGVILHLNVTAVPGGDAFTLSINMKNPVTGAYDMAWYSPSYTTTGQRLFLFYPGLDGGGTALNGVHFAQARSMVLSRTWRVQTDHPASGSFTYSVGASLIV